MTVYPTVDYTWVRTLRATAAMNRRLRRWARRNHYRPQP